MKDEQDCEIISALIVEDKMTAYALSKETGISVPQINFRIEKLVSVGVINSHDDERNKTLYSIHPVFKSNKSVESIATHIKDIFDIIDKSKETSIDGIKVVIGFILSKTEELITDEGMSIDDTKINDFKRDLNIYALKNNLKLMDVKGWTDTKIKWMALHDRKCACAPDTRICPCPEGFDEAMKKGNCKCSVFSRS